MSHLWIKHRLLRARQRSASRTEPARPPETSSEDKADLLEELAELDAEMPLGPEQATRRALWMLRLLCKLRNPSARRGPFTDDEVLQELDLDLDELDDLPRDVLRAWLGRRLAWIEQMEIAPDTISQNVSCLADWLGLGDAERELLALAATGAVSEALACCMRPFARLPAPRALALLAEVLGAPVEDVRAGLSPRSPLMSSGLIDFRPGRDGLHEAWLVLQEPFGEVLAASYEQPDELFSAICPRASGAELGVEAFPHLAREVDLLMSMLRGALRERARGVNVLLHGPPGSGKSQLVRAVAQALGVPLRQVPDARPGGDALSGDKRLATLATLQSLSQGRPGLVLFDEIEDAFPWAIEGGWMLQRSGSDKARTNRLLEDNPAPCVWVGNRVAQLDPAFVRRFSLVIELPSPPRRLREELLAAYASGFEVPRELRSELAEQTSLMPADMARAARVTALVQRGVAPEHASSVLSQADVFVRALRGAERPLATRSRSAELDYDPALVNTSVPLDQLSAGLKRRPEGNICLYGPPGTGKTAFARQLAADLDRPLLYRSAGDLLDMFVGGTEHAIAAMFDEAARSESVLLLDEAEGLMRARAGAFRGYEVTQVNELLVRMEAFRGVFLCATNGFEALDPASLRRFALRIEFRPLGCDQSLTLLGRTAAKLGLALDPAAEDQVRRRLTRLSLLTPGDFAALVRGRQLLGSASIDGLLDDLERAHAEKRSERRIGFLS